MPNSQRPYGLPSAGAGGIRLLLLSVSFVLVLASVFVYVARLGFGHDRIFGLARLFDVDFERNIPAWFGSAELLCVALLFGAIARDKMRAGVELARLWIAPALLYVLMSMDEIASFHESLRAYVGTSSHDPLAPFAWVPIGVLFVAVMSLFVVRLGHRLPAATRRRMYIAWAIYFGGAVGFEIVGALVVKAVGEQTALYAVAVHLEESGEMVGNALLIHALYLYWNDIVARFEGAAQAQPPKRSLS